jgi:ribosomal protein L23
MLLPFEGYWLEAKLLLNREDITRTENPELVSGSVPIRYDVVDNKKSEYKNGVATLKYTQVLEIDTKIEVKPYDYIYTDRWLKVEDVNLTIPDNKKHVIRMFPNSTSRWAKKVVALK